MHGWWLRLVRAATRPLNDLLANARRSAGQSILRLGVLGQRARIVVARLGEILLRLDHFENGIDPELSPLLAELQALVGKLNTSSGEGGLVQGCTRGFVGVYDLLRDVILQPRVQQLLVPKLGVGGFRAAE